MDKRIIEFIAGLRTAGVRVSLAESEDSLRAVEQIGVQDRLAFKTALKATLIKDQADERIFEKLFPLYFSPGAPPFTPPEEALSPDEVNMLRAAMRALAGDLQELIKMLSSGTPPSQEQLEEWARRAGLGYYPHHPDQQRYLTYQMLREMGLGNLMEQIEKLLAKLAELGMTPEALMRLQRLIAANQEALLKQVNAYVGATLARHMTERPRRPVDEADLMHRPFGSLSQAEMRELRRQVGRLAAHLRSRVALRQKRGKGPALDVKATLRANVRYGGVPFDVRHKHRRLKPKLALICDVSTSMRPVVDFLLRLVYEIQDQVARTRTFAFIDHLEEVSEEFAAHRPDVAVPNVLYRLPPGYYNTDLGLSLAQFCQDFLDAVDHRTTLLIVGDGRNNFNAPRLDLVDFLKRRARKIIWFNPEPVYKWGEGDSDMDLYAPLCDSVHQVSNLAELTAAVEHLFSGR